MTRNNVLKADVKLETADQLRAAHGMSGSLKRLTLKDIYRTISIKDIVGEYRNEYGHGYAWKERYRWVSLIRINPLKWHKTIQGWELNDRMAKTLSQEITKEIDAEIIKLLMDSRIETATDPEAIKQLNALIGISE
jgi:hypothetical protein